MDKFDINYMNEFDINETDMSTSVKQLQNKKNEDDIYKNIRMDLYNELGTEKINIYTRNSDFNNTRNSDFNNISNTELDILNTDK